MTNSCPEESIENIKPSVSCDACPYCEDICQNYKKCPSCIEKIRCLIRSHSFRPTNRDFSQCQITRHNTIDDCWIVAGGIVYDATSFISSHPAGVAPILSRAGGAVDATVDYEFHSDRSKDMFWRPLRIGTYSPCPGLHIPDHLERRKSANIDNCVIL